MNAYFSMSQEIDLRCFPNYSFAVGDVDGDGCPEIVFPKQDGRY